MPVERPALVVAVDGSTSALHATRWAAREASLRGLSLRLVHVCQIPYAAHPTTIGAQYEYVEALRDHGRHWLREATAAVAYVAPGVEVAAVQRVGNVAEALLKESDGAALLVLGSRGLGGFPELRAGSVAIAVAEHGRCPVVVVRGPRVEEPPPLAGPVLLGVDGFPASEAAVEFAFDAAATLGAELVAVHCWSEVTFDGVWTALPLTEDPDARAEEERRLLTERIAGWREKYATVAVRLVVVHDRPGRALLEEAERARAQLIVVGTRRLPGPAAGMGMGSTSRALLQHSECPVAVVRPDPKGDEG
jgi:nucleotide-binding universal stress UspA family protein